MTEKKLTTRVLVRRKAVNVSAGEESPRAARDRQRAEIKRRADELIRADDAKRDRDGGLSSRAVENLNRLRASREETSSLRAMRANVGQGEHEDAIEASRAEPHRYATELARARDLLTWLRAQEVLLEGCGKLALGMPEHWVGTESEVADAAAKVMRCYSAFVQNEEVHLRRLLLSIVKTRHMLLDAGVPDARISEVTQIMASETVYCEGKIRWGPGSHAALGALDEIRPLRRGRPRGSRSRKGRGMEPAPVSDTFVAKLDTWLHGYFGLKKLPETLDREWRAVLPYKYVREVIEEQRTAEAEWLAAGLGAPVEPKRRDRDGKK